MLLEIPDKISKVKFFQVRKAIYSPYKIFKIQKVRLIQSGIMSEF